MRSLAPRVSPSQVDLVLIRSHSGQLDLKETGDK